MKTIKSVVTDYEACIGNTCYVCCIGQVIDDSGICPVCQDEMVRDEMMKADG